MNALPDLLEDTARQTTACFTLPETALSRSYAPGKWTVRELLIHLSDAETVLLERVKRAIAEPEPFVYAFDQDLWCRNLEYRTFPLPLARDLYVAARAQHVYLVRQYYAARGSNPFTHSEAGRRTLKDEMEKVALHNAHHLAQIRTALNGEVPW